MSAPVVTLPCMSDIYDFMLVIDLRDDLSDAEVAELRWHLGLGPQPERLTILTEFPEVVLDDNGKPVTDENGDWCVENAPYPLLAQRGAARKIGGAVFSELVRRQDRAGTGWALTVRQELHPDDFEYVDRLLDWLAARADYAYVDTDGTTKTGGYGNYVGYQRFYENSEIDTQLTIEDGKIVR